MFTILMVLGPDEISMGELLVLERVIFEYLLQEHLVHTLYLCVYIYTTILEDKDVYLSTSLLKHRVLPKKNTRKYERTVTTSQRDIYHISSCFLYNDQYVHLEKSWK